MFEFHRQAPEYQAGKRRVAKHAGVLEDCFEYRLLVIPALANDFENFPRCRLAFAGKLKLRAQTVSVVCVSSFLQEMPYGILPYLRH